MNGNVDVKAKIVLDEEYDDGDDSEQELYAEDKVDVMALKNLVKIERRRANAAYLELEKERTAACTAVEEAMAMILRLQNERSLIEMEANQFRRLAEEKQLHDREVIQSLRWIVVKHESERSHSEDQLRLPMRKLKLNMKGDEDDQYEEADEFLGVANSNIEDDLDDALISSLDMDLSRVLLAISPIENLPKGDASASRCRFQPFPDWLPRKMEEKKRKFGPILDPSFHVHYW
ncbi:hypothetical protein F0562_020871 [Nyssa sinensis]|uniref:GTD-binding domain-containing protein n=1 Tax=Nyssa sinensis TaxID=561372 RepID=A0A5J5BS61_9ASTE|nr:hypothetical protein F0562_020871 [Nyssa sinensis]